MERRKRIWLKRFACSDCASSEIFIVCFHLVKAKQLHNLLQQLHGSIYELTERFERQKYDVRTRKKVEERFLEPLSLLDGRIVRTCSSNWERVRDPSFLTTEDLFTRQSFLAKRRHANQTLYTPVSVVACKWPIYTEWIDQNRSTNSFTGSLVWTILHRMRRLVVILFSLVNFFFIFLAKSIAFQSIRTRYVVRD